VSTLGVCVVDLRPGRGDEDRLIVAAEVARPHEVIRDRQPHPRQPRQRLNDAAIEEGQTRLRGRADQLMHRPRQQQLDGLFRTGPGEGVAADPVLFADDLSAGLGKYAIAPPSKLGQQGRLAAAGAAGDDHGATAPGRDVGRQVAVL